jgi:DNA-binding IclR family transcriptional regulator
MDHIVNRRHAAYPGTQAVRRAVWLLKTVGGASEPTLAALVRATGLNKATTYRLLTALEAEGLVERVAGEGYRLGPELAVLAGRALGSQELRDAARHELVALARATGATAHHEVRAGLETLILDEATGSHRVGTTPSVGTRWPAHATSTGKVLLAALDPADLGELLAGPLPALTPRTITRPAALRRELARVRERGYATGIEELEPGFMAVAVPVHAPDGRVVASLGVGGPRVRLDPGRLAAIARTLPEHAARITARLGAPPAPEGPERGGGRSARRRAAAGRTREGKARR